MTIPASDASLAAYTGFSGLLFPGAISIGSLLPIAFVMLSSSLPFVGGLGFLGFLAARCRPTQDHAYTLQCCPRKATIPDT